MLALAELLFLKGREGQESSNGCVQTHSRKLHILLNIQAAGCMKRL
jgi:hypothetical protein